MHRSLRMYYTYTLRLYYSTIIPYFVDTHSVHPGHSYETESARNVCKELGASDLDRYPSYDSLHQS